MKDVTLGRNVRIIDRDLVNLYGCSIGDETMIGPFVEIQRNAVVGGRCKVSSHAFICEGVTIADEVFIGHGVMFTNDRYPRATNDDGTIQTGQDWAVEKTSVARGASIGSNVTVLGGVNIGEGALVGAGAVLTKDVPAFAITVGIPAQVIGDVRRPTRQRSEEVKRGKFNRRESRADATENLHTIGVPRSETTRKKFETTRKKSLEARKAMTQPE